MPPYSCCTPGRKPGHVDERHQRNVEGVAEADEARRLVGGVDVERAGQRQPADWRSMPTGRPMHPRKADDDVRRVAGLHFEEIAVVDDAR